MAGVFDYLPSFPNSGFASRLGGGAGLFLVRRGAPGDSQQLVLSVLGTKERVLHYRVKVYPEDGSVRVLDLAKSHKLAGLAALVAFYRGSPAATSMPVALTLCLPPSELADSHDA